MSIPSIGDTFYVDTSAKGGSLFLPSTNVVAGSLYTFKDTLGTFQTSTLSISTTSSTIFNLDTRFGFNRFVLDCNLDWTSLETTQFDTLRTSTFITSGPLSTAGTFQGTNIQPSTLYFTDNTVTVNNSLFSLSNNLYNSITSTIGVFPPLSIAGNLTFWLDASDSSTTTFTGSNLTLWKDKSGNGYNMSNFSTYSNGVLASNFQNGLDVINFSGNNLYKTDAGGGRYPSDCYIVIALKSPLTRCDVISVTSPNTDSFNSLTFGEFTSLRWHNGSSFFNRTSNTVAASNETSSNFLIMNWSLANSNFVIRRNGLVLSQVSSYTFISNFNYQVQIGYRGAAGLSAPDVVLSAYIGEVLLFNEQLIESNRQTVEGYLAWKWGLQSNLQSNHPFRNSPPTYNYESNTVIGGAFTAVPKIQLASAFSPLNINANLILWLDGNDRNSIITGSDSAPRWWLDKSGRGNDFYSSAGTRPTISNAAINGRSALGFVGNGIASGGSYQYLDSTTISVNGSNYSIFVVAKQNASQPSWTQYNYILKGNFSNDYFLFFGNNQSKFFAIFTGTNSAWNDTNANVPNFTFQNPAILGMTVSTTVLTPYFNGITQNTKTGTTCNFTSMRIGDAADNFRGQTFNGAIGEIIFYNTTLNTQQRQQIEGYLGWKWGLQNSLPITHPYRFYAP